MNINDLVPASALALRLGVKALVYGDPGSGKTPALNTAPRPILCACEPGMGSMRKSNVPAWEAYTPPRVHEFFEWFFKSREADNFDTLGIDSTSQLAEIVLAAEMPRHKDPRKAYGEMSRYVAEKLTALYFLKNKHVYLIAKKMVFEDHGAARAKPWFPGKDLMMKIPHLYDEILHMEKVIAPDGKMYPCFRTKDNGLVLARDRGGQLDELEPTDLTALFTKAMK